MKYGEFRDHVLQLIDQFSSNGVVLDNLYNDQSDYVLRIPSLYNSAMIDITAFFKPIVDVFDASEQFEHHHHHDRNQMHHHHDEWTLIDLPDDFIKMRPVLVTEDGRAYRSNRYYMVGDNMLCIHRSLLRPGCVLEYEREPRKLDITPGADIEGVNLDGDRQQLLCAALYVASRLVMQSDSFAYTSLMNEYDSRCSNMESQMDAETLYSYDVYGFDSVNNYGAW